MRAKRKLWAKWFYMVFVLLLCGVSLLILTSCASADDTTIDETGDDTVAESSESNDQFLADDTTIDETGDDTVAESTESNDQFLADDTTIDETGDDTVAESTESNDQFLAEGMPEDESGSTSDPVLSDPYRQLTEEELALDTRPLAELVIQSAYIQDYYACSTPERAEGFFDRACEYFNGLRELLTRGDAADTLAKIYIGAAAHYAQYGDIASYSTMTWSAYLLSQPVFEENLTVKIENGWASTNSGWTYQE